MWSLNVQHKIAIDGKKNLMEKNYVFRARADLRNEGMTSML